jgi:3-(3-hydroxy-phenyl)propionate hydroxylase
MVQKGVIWNVGKVFVGADEDPRYSFDMLPVKGQKMPGFINLQQYHAEEILLSAIARHDCIDIRWGHQATGLAQSGETVCLSVETCEGTYQIETDWLIACDGCHSPVRNMLGLDFEGRIFEDNFLIADVKFKEERPSERWFWFDPPFNPGRSALLHKQPDDVWRLDFQLGWDIDREACVKPENVAPFVQGMLGDDVAFTEEWYSVYTFQCRRMRHFVHDRVIFAGDSAHLVSPFGARGCNGGVADADNLAWKLDLVLTSAADHALIDSYNYEAVVTADENILNSSRSTDFMTPKSAISLAFRDAVLELAGSCSFARPFVNSGRLSTAVSYPDSMLVTPDVESWDGGVLPGSPLLDAPIGDGWLLDRLGGEFMLVRNGGDASLDGLRLIDLAEYPEADVAVARCGLPKGAALLVRPDQYLAARWKHPTSGAIAKALAKSKGTVDHGNA